MLGGNADTSVQFEGDLQTAAVNAAEARPVKLESSIAVTSPVCAHNEWDPLEVRPTFFSACLNHKHVSVYVAI